MVLLGTYSSGAFRIRHLTPPDSVASAHFTASPLTLCLTTRSWTL